MIPTPEDMAALVEALQGIKSRIDLWPDRQQYPPNGSASEQWEPFYAANRARGELQDLLPMLLAALSAEPVAALVPVDAGDISDATRRMEKTLGAKFVRHDASPTPSGEEGWIRIPKPTLDDLTAIGEAAEGAVLSEMGWAEVGHVVWDLITVDAEVTDWSSAIRGKFYTPKSPEATAHVDGPFRLGERVEKTKGSSWRGKIVGTYSTSLTPIGYAVESENEPGSVQIYPVSALRALIGTGEGRG